MSWQRTGAGVRQFAAGLFKKAFIADHLAGFVDYAFENDAALGGATLFVALLAYTVQIYCDFSGYSDMAIGAARILGYDFSENFNHPYLSRSIQEFWRRWHISLSSWLRDYLYIPLGGNRIGPVRTYINLLLTMVLGGLWHGAAWTFIIWGAWHGAWLSLHRWWAARCEKRGLLDRQDGAFAVSLKWSGTMIIVMLGWLFFRSASLEQAFRILGSILSLEAGITWLPWIPMLCIGLVVARHLVLLSPRLDGALSLKPGRAQAFAITLMVAVAWLFSPEDFQPFIYFQF